MVAIGLLGAAAIARLVPHLPSHPGAGLRSELATFRSGQLWLALTTVVFGCAGLFACYTYITPALTDVAGFAEGSVTLVLALFGVGMTLGNVIAATRPTGRCARRSARPSWRWPARSPCSR
nr:hypothetical protein [Kitasatospora fiedleri]